MDTPTNTNAYQVAKRNGYQAALSELAAAFASGGMIGGLKLLEHAATDPLAKAIAGGLLDRHCSRETLEAIQ